MMGLAMLLALTVGLASTALAGTGVGARFDLGRTNTVDVVSRLVGSVSGPTLALRNDASDRAATTLSLQMGNPKLAPMRTNATGKVGNLNADQLDGRDSSTFAIGNEDGSAIQAIQATSALLAQNAGKLDGKDSTEFASGVSGKANDADRLDGKDSGEFLPRRTYNKNGNVVDNSGFFQVAKATCGAGDLALSGGHRMSTLGADTQIVSERTVGDSYEMSFVADDSVTANVTCADFPPLR
jgi:hypothetical protein